MRLLALAAPAVLVFVVSGCHSAFIEATISNRTAAPISNIEVEYPSASFGTPSLPPGRDFHYRFKVQGDGPLKVHYSGADHREQQSEGPPVKEGDEGQLTLHFDPDGVHWQLPLSKR